MKKDKNKSEHKCYEKAKFQYFQIIFYEVFHTCMFVKKLDPEGSAKTSSSIIGLCAIMIDKDIAVAKISE